MLGFRGRRSPWTAWLERSVIGHRLLAIRENEDAAQALGINPMRYKLFAAGAPVPDSVRRLYAHYVTFIDPHMLLNMNMALEITDLLDSWSIGTLWGPLLGLGSLVPVAEAIRATFGKSYAGIHLVVYGAQPDGRDPLRALDHGALFRSLPAACGPCAFVRGRQRR